MKKIFLVCLLCILPWSVSQAETKALFSASVGQVSWDDDENDFSADPINLFFRGGVAFNQYFDVGVEWGTTLVDDKKDNVEFEVETILIFAKANFAVTERIQLYALAGISSVDLIANQRKGTRVGSYEDEGTAVGVGIQFGSDDAARFMVEYINYYQDDEEFDDLGGDFSLSSINFGYVGYF